MLTSTRVAPLARDPDGGGRAPDREAQEEVRDHDGDDAGADRPAHGHADAGRTARGRVAVVAVDQDDRDREHQQLAEGPQHVDRRQELEEVVVVGARRLPVDVDGDEAGREVGRAEGHDVERDHRDERRDHPGRDQERQRGDPHHLERVDLLGDPHRAEPGGVAAAHGRGQGDRGDQRRHLAGVEVGRDEGAELRDPDLAERGVALDAHLGAGEEREERDHAGAPGDQGQAAATEGDLGEGVDDLARVAADRPRRPGQGLDVEEQLVAVLLQGLLAALDYRTADRSDACHVGPRLQPRWGDDLEVDGGDHGVEEEQQHERDDHGLVDRATHPARPAARVEALVGADDRGQPAEDDGLDHRDVEVRQTRQHGEVGQEGTGGPALDDDGEEVAAADAGCDHDPVDHHGHEHRGHHARRHQPLERVDAEDLHGVDLLANLARPHVGADGRAGGSGDDQRRRDGSGLADSGQHRGGSREGLRTELAGEVADLERDDGTEGDRDQDRRHQRDAGDEPRLLDELAELEGSGEDPLGDLDHHRGDLAWPAEDRNSAERHRSPPHRATAATE